MNSIDDKQKIWIVLKIILAHFTRSGHTGEMADLIAEELRSRGHVVDTDEIKVTKKRNRFYMLMTVVPLVPAVLLSLILKSFRNWHYNWYKQQEFDIQPPAYPDVSAWTYNSPYGKASIRLFCDKLESNDDPEKASAQADEEYAINGGVSK